MKTLFRMLPLVLLAVTALESCKKDTRSADPVAEEPVTPAPSGPTGSLKLEFKNTVDTQDLVLGTSYKNPNGEEYTLSKFKYYISNIVLTKNDNSTLVLKEVYQIIDQSDEASKTILLKNVPAATYQSIKFILGVDSARNRSGAQTGGLDVAYASDMYWNWNQGYIFLKLEGTSPTSTLATNGIEYHMGGFGGANKTQREFGFHFPSTKANVSESITPKIRFSVNVNEIFKTPNPVSFATMPVVVSAGVKAKALADNYSDMISFDTIEN